MIEDARSRDAVDPLAGYRQRFYLPAGQIYLDGNSLGLLSRDAEEEVLRALDDWKRLGIGGWLEAGWFTLAEKLASGIAGLIGAEANEVGVGNSTTVNLHQLLGTLHPANGRKRVLAFAGEFPSDLYAIRAFLRSRGLEDQMALCAPGADGLIDEEALVRTLESDRSLHMAVLPSVVYTTGQLLDLERLTASAHRGGVLIGFDLSHSIGVVPHHLTAAGVDCAIWCHYKYLNAGPGALGGWYLNPRHFGRLPALGGWWGIRKEQMFTAGAAGEYAADASGLQIGTPTILGLAALQGALRITTEAGIKAIRRKSVEMTAYLAQRIEESMPGSFRFASPRSEHKRGGHVALLHLEASRICRALGNAGVIADHRPPDILRLAPAPLYNSFADCHQAVEILRRIMEDKTYLALPDQMSLVP